MFIVHSSDLYPTEPTGTARLFKLAKDLGLRNAHLARGFSLIQDFWGGTDRHFVFFCFLSPAQSWGPGAPVALQASLSPLVMPVGYWKYTNIHMLKRHQRMCKENPGLTTSNGHL